MVQEFNDYSVLSPQWYTIKKWLKEFSDPMMGIRRFVDAIKSQNKPAWLEILSLHNIDRFTCLEKGCWKCITSSVYSDISNADRAEDWGLLFAGLFVSYPEAKNVIESVVERTKARKQLRKEQRNIKDSLDAMDNAYKNTKEFADALKNKCNRIACINYNDMGISIFMWNKKYMYKYRTSERIMRIKRTELTEEMMQKALDLISERCIYD